MDKSTNHLFFYSTFEYFTHENAVYRAPIANPIMRNGYRNGARFEGYLHSLPLLKKVLGIEEELRNST